MQKNARKNAQNTQPTEETAEKLTCLICGKDFTDGWEHSLESRKGTPFLVPIDKAHSIVTKIPEQGDTCPLCGSRVDHMGIPPDGWEITCSGCGFLFDED